MCLRLSATGRVEKFGSIIRWTNTLLALAFLMRFVDNKKYSLIPGLSFNYKIISTQTENIPWKLLSYRLVTSMKHVKMKANMIMGDYSN